MADTVVSVIIPCYNHGHYLPDALDSVLAQTFSDWEAIVVDDGSADNTAAVGNRCAERDFRVRYVYQENAGLAAARNAAIRIAKGEFLAFLDADDAWEPAFLRTCVAALSERPQLAAVYTLYRLMDEHGVVFGHDVGSALSAHATRVRLLRAGFFPPCAVLARSGIVRDAGAFDAGMDGRGTEDWDLWLRITAKGDMAGIPEPLARYRLVAGSMSTDVERMHRNRMAVLAKHFGPQEGEPEAWPPDKREAYAWAYQSAAVQYISQGQAGQGWEKLAQAAAIWPDILVQPETAYELACWDQPRGYRGQAETLDLERNAALVLAGLDGIFAQGGEALRSVRGAAYGQAYLALAMLGDQAGRWGLARRHLARAIRRDPGLLAAKGVARRLAKVCAGRSVVDAARRLRGRLSASEREA